jgi:hypothetical protein
MRKVNLIKVFVLVAGLTLGFSAFLFTRKSETQTIEPNKTPEKVIDVKKVIDVQREIADFRKWTKVNDEPYLMWSNVAAMCRMPTKKDYEMDKSIHKNKYVDIYVNSLGKDEMMTKRNPLFPVGTVIIKEKFSGRDRSTAPELLTVMVKREKGFNPEVGDWEFATVNGEGTKVTAQGKLESCQACHVNYEKNDFVTRVYLPQNIERTLK